MLTQHDQISRLEKMPDEVWGHIFNHMRDENGVLLFEAIKELRLVSKRMSNRIVNYGESSLRYNRLFTFKIDKDAKLACYQNMLMLLREDLGGMDPKWVPLFIASYAAFLGYLGFVITANDFPDLKSVIILSSLTLLFCFVKHKAPISYRRYIKDYSPRTKDALGHMFSPEEIESLSHKSACERVEKAIDELKESLDNMEGTNPTITKFFMVHQQEMPGIRISVDSDEQQQPLLGASSR